MYKVLLYVSSLLCAVQLVGCVGAPPVREYILAHTALEAAKSANTAKFAPGLTTQAEDYYRQALVDYEDRRYNYASANFQRARTFAEKAENYTVLKKAESGDF